MGREEEDLCLTGYTSLLSECVQTEMKHITAAVTHIKHHFTVCCDTDEREKTPAFRRAVWP